MRVHVRRKCTCLDSQQARSAEARADRQSEWSLEHSDHPCSRASPKRADRAGRAKGLCRIETPVRARRCDGLCLFVRARGRGAQSTALSLELRRIEQGLLVPLTEDQMPPHHLE